jgi:hypothetical protein
MGPAIEKARAATEDSEQGGDEGKYPVSEGDLRKVGQR